MTTLGAAYFIQNNISLTVEYRIKFQNAQTRKINILQLKDDAISYRFETKFYNVIHLTKNVHLALIFSEVKIQYNNNFNYFKKR